MSKDVNKQTAEKLFASTTHDVLWANPKGEFFTSENIGSLSLKAGQKLTKSLVYGHKLLLQDDDLSYIVAICSSSLDSFENITPAEQYIHIYKVDEDEITLIKAFENDVYLKKLKPAIVLPQIFMKFNVNIFLSRRVGEGLKNSLLAKGIQIIEKDVKVKDDLKNLLSF